jgi:hypothetical protein
MPRVLQMWYIVHIVCSAGRCEFNQFGARRHGRRERDGLVEYSRHAKARAGTARRHSLPQAIAFEGISKDSSALPAARSIDAAFWPVGVNGLAGEAVPTEGF